MADNDANAAMQAAAAQAAANPTANAPPAAPAPPQPAPPVPRAATFELRVKIADLRNGDVADITSAAPRSSIPISYKWVHISGMRPDDYANYVDEVIRATYAQVLTSYGDNPTDAERRSAKNTAIALGATRAGAAAALRLTQADLANNECAGSGSTFANSNVTAGAGTAGGRYATARTMSDLTVLEVSVVNTVMYLGMSVPILQGVSLMMSGHHFIPTTRNLFMGMKKQALQASGPDVVQWVENMGDAFDDAVFHKACHPVLIPLKRGWAKQEAMASKLRASGHGAAAIRLPAIPSDAHAGKAAHAVVIRAKPVIVGMGHTCTHAEIEALIRKVELAPAGTAEMSAVDAVRSWYEAHKSTIAFCAGIVSALRDASGGGADTTLRAYSIRKAVADHPADNATGTNYARAHLSRQRESAITGQFADPQIQL